MTEPKFNATTFRSVLLALSLGVLAGCNATSGGMVNDGSSTGQPSSVEPPVAPTELKAVAGNAQASLTWLASAGADSYDVQRSASLRGPFVQVASVQSPSYTDSGVTNGVTYIYVVRAVNAAGESPDSAAAMVRPDPAVTTPAVPMDVSVNAGDGQAIVTWAASSGATSYHVKRATSSGGPYAQIAVSGSTSYTDTSLSNGTTYYYVISALDSAGESVNSSQVSAKPAAVLQAPAAPTNLKATASNRQATLSWSASVGAIGYIVKRATTSGGPYAQVAAPVATTYTETSLANGTIYYYVVAARAATAESKDSAQVSARPTAPTAQVAIPAAPASPKATAGNAQASLSWSASGGATSYHVKRATNNGGPYTQVGAPTATSYSDTSLSNGTTYYYVVSALDAAGESANSAQVSAQPTAPATIPAAPSALSATAGNGSVSLSWPSSGGASSYHVKRAATSGGPYTQVGAPSGTSYTDSSLANGTTYYYVVTALNSAGESANSMEANATPATPVSAPTTFGTWINVTPAVIDLTNTLSCQNFGTQSVGVDQAHPSDVYIQYYCQGIWKSTDYGATWTGPINTGSNGSTVKDCAGGITVAASPTSGPPTIYESCIRGAGTGFWRSVDGGVNWTRYMVAPTGSSRQDYYPPVVDPYDANHLLMAGHEMDYVVESTDGGQNWTNVPLNNGMLENGGTAKIFFINTGNASSTRATWLWLGQQNGGGIGTWRTTNSGTSWTQVDHNEHPHGAGQIYQPDNSGVVYMGGAYSALGWGVLRSADYGQTWSHVGGTGNESVVFGSSKNVYAMYGWAVGLTGSAGPNFEVAAQPGTGNWASPATPAGLTTGAGQVATTNDGTHNIFIGAMWGVGAWRYIEP